MRNARRKQITIKDVAAKAGVSVGTVSRVLSGRGYASDESRRKVLRAVKELGYRPHGLARSLKLQRTDTVGLLITDVVNPFYSLLAAGVLECARKLGYHVIVSATDEEPELEREYLEVLMEERAAGVIAVPTGKNVRCWKEAVELGTEVVLVDREVNGFAEADVVLVDNVKGAQDAVSYLIGLGHRRIGIITGPLETTTGAGRLEGYRRAHQEAGLPIDESLVEVVSFKRESGIHAAQRLLSLPDPPTAFFAGNNALGEAALTVIRERGLSIPADISLIMFDDVPWACHTSPRLTVVNQPTHDLGYIGMEVLDRRLRALEEGTEIARQKTILMPELIVRESCAEPRPR